MSNAYERRPSDSASLPKTPNLSAAPQPMLDLCAQLQRLRHFLGEKDLERYGIAPCKTLQRWRLDGSGPPWIRLAGKSRRRGSVKYDPVALAKWIELGKRNSTSDGPRAERSGDSVGSLADGR